jgi:ligand-binding sensor domain-containing protein
MNSFLILSMAALRSSKLTILFCSILFNCQYCLGQSYTLSSFPDDELSSPQINCIFQDKKGFVWIGTANGLNLYDANSIRVFKHNVKNKNSVEIVDTNIPTIL